MALFVLNNLEVQKFECLIYRNRMKINMNAFLLVLLLLVQSCASKRISEKPNFNLSGKEAEKEIKKYKLRFVNIYYGGFDDELFKNFNTKELRPLMKEVSPKSLEMLEKTKVKEMINWGILAFGLSTFFVKDSDGKQPLYWWGLGSIIGYGIYINIERDKVADQFNEDLKGKFIPSVGYSLKFD